MTWTCAAQSADLLDEVADAMNAARAEAWPVAPPRG
jgi:hypothetical protein